MDPRGASTYHRASSRMRTKNTTPFLFCATASSLRPPAPLMTLVVKASFRLRPGAPVEPLTGIGEQGTLSGDVFDPGDEERTGQLLYASDFADFKPRTDLLVRAACHTPGGKPLQECPARVTVGAWTKLLRVLGRRVWKDGFLGASPSEPAPFTTMPIDHAHAFGGPELADNPSGLGLGTVELHNIEAPGDVVRSKSDRIHPASFGPLSPFWPARRSKVGKEYGASWAAKRKPYYAEDFDLAYFQSAPPDQQVDWLRGDEEISFQNLHPTAAVFTTRLPAVRVRVFVNCDQKHFREVKMRLDTVLADLDDERLVLTWRGIDEVREDDLADVKTVLIASEALASEPRDEALYAEDLAAFERDPIGFESALPAPPQDTAAEDDSDDPLWQKLSPELDDLQPADRERIRRSVRRLSAHSVPGVDLRAAIARALSPVPSPAPRVLPAMQPGAAPAVRLGDVFAKVRQAVDRFTKTAAAQGQTIPGSEKLAALESNPMLARLGAGGAGEGTDEPGPGANLSGRDLSGQDLSGRDLTGANLEGAILQRTKLTGAILVRAKLGRAVLTEADLEGADLTGADLSHAHLGQARAAGAVLRGAKLDQAVFDKTALQGADLSGATGKLAVLAGADLTDAVLAGAAFEQALFDEAVLVRADFRAAQLKRCRFSKCEARGANFSGTSLAHTSFSESDLSGAVFRDAAGEGAIFSQATLTEADFEHAVLPESHFTEAKADHVKLSGADLPRARFYRASLRSAVLDGANLLYADLRKADLQGASARRSNLYGAKLQHARRQGLDLAGANLGHVLLEAGG
jgi:uncharacterized protein YjbI with pentapeptide repeats